jgi:hypothetical protein
MLLHYAGDYASSSLDLQEAERQLREAYTKSITQNIASYLTNDTVKDYAGEDFEDIYLNIFNALNYYNQGDTEGAMVEIRKLTMSSGKLDMLARKYQDDAKKLTEQERDKIGTLTVPENKPNTFTDSALARYLAGIFYRGEGKTDDARIEFEKIAAAFAASPDVYKNKLPPSVAAEKNIPAGNARLNIIGFAGLSPLKEEELTFLRFIGPATGAELMLKIALPVMVERRPSVISRIAVEVEGGERFELELLEDMAAAAVETFNAKKTITYIKTIVRAVTKVIAADTAAARLIDAGVPEGIAAFGLNLAAAVSEAADTRSSRYLPGRAYVGGVNLAPGVYTVTIHYYSNSGIIDSETKKNITVKENALNLLEIINVR